MIYYIEYFVETESLKPINQVRSNLPNYHHILNQDNYLLFCEKQCSPVKREY